MRRELLYNPRLLIERLAQESHRRRRLAPLKGTPAASLPESELGTLELLQLIPHARSILDIGAYYGSWTALAKARFPDATVHAFDPIAEHTQLFARTTAGLTNVYLYEIALGALDGEATLHIANPSHSSSLYQPEPAQHQRFGTGETATRVVPVRRLDGAREKLDIPAPDLMKLDVQGAELSVLNGAPDTLRQTQWLIVEVSFVQYYGSQPLFPEVIAYLDECGFAPHALGMETPLGRPLDQIDILFRGRALQ